jgi:hypothetical protein
VAAASAKQTGAAAAPVQPRAPIDEEANQRALDEAAGVAEVRRSSLAPPPAIRPQNAMPLLKADTPEKRLYKIACSGTPLGAEFFDEFPDTEKILELALSISVRLLVVAICNSEVSPAQRISAMRLVAALNGKQTGPTDEEQPARPAPPSAPSVDVSSAIRSIDKIRALAAAQPEPEPGPRPAA